MKREYGGDTFYGTMIQRMKELEWSAEDPKVVFDAVENTLRSKNPPLRQMVGSWLQKIYIKVPPAQYDKLIKAFYLRGIKPLSKL